MTAVADLKEETAEDPAPEVKAVPDREDVSKSENRLTPTLAFVCIRVCGRRCLFPRMTHFNTNIHIS